MYTYMCVCIYIYKIRVAYHAVGSHFPAMERKKERKKGWREKVEELSGLIPAAAPRESTQSLISAMGKSCV